MVTTHILELRPSRASEVTPEAASQIFSSIAGLKSSFIKRLMGREKPIVFEIISFDQKTHFLVHLPPHLSSYIESQIAAQYPKSSLIAAIDPLTERIKGKHLSFGSLTLSSISYLPIKTWREFTDSDPLASILGSMAKAEESDVILVQIVVLPTGTGWQAKGARVIASGIIGSDGVRKPHPKAALIERKISQNGLRTQVRLLVASREKERSRQLLSSLAGSFGGLSLGDASGLVFSNPPLFRKGGFLKSILSRSKKFVPLGQILTVDELATIFHQPGLALSEIRKEDRRRHVYIMGKTGTGKSTLIANMAINDMKNGEGLAVVDPHGDLSEILLDYIPSWRINDVAYLDAAASLKHPFRMNLFEVKTQGQGELVASGIVSIFQKLYGFSWGPRLEYILRNSILTLIGRPESTLVDVPRILTDRAFRLSVVDKLADPVLRNFWVSEFEKMGDRLQSEAISPILNKVGQFVSSPTIREIIGYPKSTINLEDVMNQGKIVILNLSQGRLGEDNAALLGAMMITKIQLAAMNRASVSEEERRDFYLYVDEFQNFATTSFIKILSEARKYRLNLTLANQYIGQVPEDVQKAIFGNVGTLISFLVGAEDAAILTREFGGVYKEEELVSLDNFQVILKLAIDGKTSRPFFSYSLPLPESKNSNREKVMKVSQERYTREPASEVKDGGGISPKVGSQRGPESSKRWVDGKGWVAVSLK